MFCLTVFPTAGDILLGIRIFFASKDGLESARYGIVGIALVSFQDQIFRVRFAIALAWFSRNASRLGDQNKAIRVMARFRFMFTASLTVGLRWRALRAPLCVQDDCRRFADPSRGGNGLFLSLEVPRNSQAQASRGP